MGHGKLRCGADNENDAQEYGGNDGDWSDEFK